MAQPHSESMEDLKMKFIALILAPTVLTFTASQAHAQVPGNGLMQVQHSCNAAINPQTGYPMMYGVGKCNFQYDRYRRQWIQIPYYDIALDPNGPVQYDRGYDASGYNNGGGVTVFGVIHFGHRRHDNQR